MRKSEPSEPQAPTHPAGALAPALLLEGPRRVSGAPVRPFPLARAHRMGQDRAPARWIRLDRRHLQASPSPAWDRRVTSDRMARQGRQPGAGATGCPTVRRNLRRRATPECCKCCRCCRAGRATHPGRTGKYFVVLRPSIHPRRRCRAAHRAVHEPERHRRTRDNGRSPGSPGQQAPEGLPLSATDSTTAVFAFDHRKSDRGSRRASLGSTKATIGSRKWRVPARAAWHAGDR